MQRSVLVCDLQTYGRKGKVIIKEREGSTVLCSSVLKRCLRRCWEWNQCWDLSRNSNAFIIHPPNVSHKCLWYAVPIPSRMLPLLIIPGFIWLQVFCNTGRKHQHPRLSSYQKVCAALSVKNRDGHHHSRYLRYNLNKDAAGSH